MDTQNLLSKPIWQMTGEEFLTLPKKEARKNRKSSV
jgi:hypothetical protein